MAGTRQPVWDLPVRLFHWTLAVLIVLSWWTAQSGQLDLHLYSGSAILTLVVFRVLWGFFGSSTARFSSFLRGPRKVMAFVRDPQSWASAGHTPLGALSIVAMLAAIAVQVLLGMFSVDTDGLFEGPLAHFLSIAGNDQARGFHEAWFWVVVALVAMHIVAVIVYRLRNKKLTIAMITGIGETPPGSPPLRRGKWWVALLCLAAGLAVTRWLLAGAPPLGG